MARVAAPLMSLSASGTIAKAITFSTWKGRPYVRTRIIPANPRSGLQVGMRAGIAGAPVLWNDVLNATYRAAWNVAVGAEAISGYNLYCRRTQQNLRNNYGPAILYPSTARAEVPAAPAGPTATQNGVDMDVAWTVEPAALAYLIFHATTTGFTSGIATLIKVPREAAILFKHINPGLGTHYYDIRSCGSDGGVGALAGEFNGAIV